MLTHLSTLVPDLDFPLLLPPETTGALEFAALRTIELDALFGSVVGAGVPCSPAEVARSWFSGPSTVERALAITKTALLKNLCTIWSALGFEVGWWGS